MSSSIYPASFWAGAEKSQAGALGGVHATAGLPPSLQTGIVKGRGGNVAEKYGQITPPDNTPPSEASDGKSSTASSQAGRVKKLDRSERARNAANQRHAKAKKARQDRADSQDDVAQGSDSEGSIGGKREKYREKNRLAAAKCRAKKKTNVETLEDHHRELSATNSFLRRQERQLRDELSMVRTLALQHGPSAQGCRCANLHAYNQRKANEIAYGYPSVSSPSDFGSSLASPSVDPMGRTQSLPGSAPASMADMFSRHHSFAAPPSSNFAFAQVTTPQDMAMTSTASASNDDNQQQNFSSFLHNSPGGRAGFA